MSYPVVRREMLTVTKPGILRRPKPPELPAVDSGTVHVLRIDGRVVERAPTPGERNWGVIDALYVIDTRVGSGSLALTLPCADNSLNFDVALTYEVQVAEPKRAAAYEGDDVGSLIRRLIEPTLRQAARVHDVLQLKECEQSLNSRFEELKTLTDATSPLVEYGLKLVSMVATFSLSGGAKKHYDELMEIRLAGIRRDAAHGSELTEAERTSELQLRETEHSLKLEKLKQENAHLLQAQQAEAQRQIQLQQAEAQRQIELKQAEARLEVERKQAEVHHELALKHEATERELQQLRRAEWQEVLSQGEIGVIAAQIAQDPNDLPNILDRARKAKIDQLQAILEAQNALLSNEHLDDLYRQEAAMQAVTATTALLHDQLAQLGASPGSTPAVGPGAGVPPAPAVAPAAAADRTASVDSGAETS